MWPRRKRWSLMGSLAPPITSRFGVAAQEFYPKGNVPSPNYEFFDEESGGWSADKNNAAINAAMARQAQIPQYDDTMGAGVATKKKGPTAEERAEAWKQAMADAQGFMAPMQGDTIPGVSPGGGSREHQMSVYNTGGYDLTSNRPISDTDAVRKRLYGIMGFA